MMNNTMNRALGAVVFAGLLCPALATAQNQQHFETPEAAVDALLEAFRTNEDDKLLALFGQDHRKLVIVTDQIARAEALAELYSAAQEMKKLETAGDDTRVVIIGHEDWPFPIPIVKESAGWRFDTAAGEEEILNRRIGKNELEAISNCRAYVRAQLDYSARDRDGDEVLEYAQKVASTPGKKDGLYWEVDPASGEELSPFGPLLADAAAYKAEASKSEARIPYHGYYYKLLVRQGANPPGGTYDYIINGNMIAGFALVASPADHSSSGVMTFVVSHQGKVYEKDLGEKTLEIFESMNEFDPDATWSAAE